MRGRGSGGWTIFQGTTARREVQQDATSLGGRRFAARSFVPDTQDDREAANEGPAAAAGCGRAKA